MLYEVAILQTSVLARRDMGEFAKTLSMYRISDEDV